jgi:hypothetical protein
LPNPVDGQIFRDPEQIVAQEAGRTGAAVELQHFDVGLLRDFVGFLFIPQTGVDEPDQRAVVLTEQAGQGRHVRAGV